MSIRNVTLQDAKSICDIYNYYIKDTIITFEDEVVSEKEIKERISKILKKGYPYIVYEEDGCVVGYAYVDNWRTRKAYDITLETSIYLDKDSIGKGIGRILYQELINKARQINIYSLIGVVSLPNEPSQKIHADLGFELIGNFKESGRKFDKLIDVEFWQLFL